MLRVVSVPPPEAIVNQSPVLVPQTNGSPFIEYLTELIPAHISTVSTNVIGFGGVKS